MISDLHHFKKNFNIRMGIPEMQELWLDLQEKYRSGNIKKKEEQLYKKWRIRPNFTVGFVEQN